jgi:hypothetical protein
MVYQHFSLFDTLTVAENVWLGWTRPARWRRCRAHRRGGAHLRAGRGPAAPGAHAERGREAARGDRARAADQPAAADPGRAHLGAHAAGGGQALRHAAPLADGGCSILYISHKLDEIRALCHHCTVLRGGKVTGEVDPTQESNASLSRLMIGAEPPPLQHGRHAGRRGAGGAGLSLARQDPFGVDLQDIGFEVRAGEIVGMAGVSGNGQQELMAALSGEDRRARPAASAVRGQDIARTRRAAPPRGPALRARGAPGPRRRAHAEPGAEHAADAHAPWRRAAGSRRRDVRAGRH